jgi:hypothetical protein
MAIAVAILVLAIVAVVFLFIVAPSNHRATPFASDSIWNKPLDNAAPRATSGERHLDQHVLVQHANLYGIRVAGARAGRAG